MLILALAMGTMTLGFGCVCATFFLSANDQSDFLCVGGKNERLCAAGEEGREKAGNECDLSCEVCLLDGSILEV